MVNVRNCCGQSMPIDYLLIGRKPAEEAISADGRSRDQRWPHVVQHMAQGWPRCLCIREIRMRPDEVEDRQWTMFRSLGSGSQPGTGIQLNGWSAGAWLLTANRFE